MIFESDHSLQSPAVLGVKHFEVEASRLFGILLDPESFGITNTPRVISSSFPSNITFSFENQCRVVLKITSWSSRFTELQVSITGFQNEEEQFDQEKYWNTVVKLVEKRFGIDSPVVASAPGKVNVFFNVGALGEDGFHEVASCYQALALREKVHIEHSGKLEISFHGNFAELSREKVPQDETNLVYRAAEILSNKRPNSNPQLLSFAIHKDVPIAGGMAGGSADAAAALMAINRLWSAGQDNQLENLGVELGADVPFSLMGGTAIGLGRGEKLSRVETKKELHWVMSLSNLGLSTPDVYRKLDEIRLSQGLELKGISEPIVPVELIEAVTKGDAESLAHLMQNDLEIAAIALRPELRQIIADGEIAGALRSMISGSGPTVAHLAKNRIDAEQIASRLTRMGHQIITTFSTDSGARLEG
jgi:4-diphosphocytidyl-2-C-methyl-D-erythritol kinase